MGFAITPINGRSGRFTANGENISIEDEQVEFKTDRVDVTGTEDQQADGRTPQNITDTVDSMTGSINASVNADQMPAVVGLKPGEILTDVRFYLDKNVAPRYCGASLVMVLSIKYMGKVRDAWKFSLQVESTGGFDCVFNHPT